MSGLLLFILLFWVAPIALAFFGGRWVGHMEGKNEAENKAQDQMMRHLYDRSEI